MTVVVVPVLIVLAVLVLLAGGAFVLSRSQRRRLEQAQGQRSLRYRVRPGEDPVSVATALRAAGFDVVSDDGLLVVTGDDPEQDREQVRDVVRSAPINLEGDPRAERPVRFLDEQGGRGTHGP